MRPFTPFKFWVVESRNSRGGLNPPCSCFNTRNRWSSLRWHSRRASNGFDDIGLGQTEERGRWAFLWQQCGWCKRFCTQQIERNLRRDLWQWCWTFYKVFFWQWWYFCNQNDNDAMKAMKMVAIKICKPIWVSLIVSNGWMASAKSERNWKHWRLSVIEGFSRPPRKERKGTVSVERKGKTYERI